MGLRKRLGTCCRSRCDFASPDDATCGKMPRMKWLKALWWLYALGGVVSLLVMPASAFGWLGLKPDPSAGDYAIVMALPWSLLLGGIGTIPLEVAMMLLGAGITMNLLLLDLLMRWLRR